MQARIAEVIVVLASVMLTLGVGTARADVECHTECYTDSSGYRHCDEICD
jgi:hypothetical protein